MSVGDKFDPAVHDADVGCPREGASHNTIANVRLPGYEFGEEEAVIKSMQGGCNW